MNTEILQAIHDHAGTCTWYHLERSLSHCDDIKAGRLFDLLDVLTRGGLVSAERSSEQPHPTYKLTAKGKEALKTGH
jgi:DNA-binding PadR family transcriptional regulator